MVRIFFLILLAVESFALWNRGGGPLMSHLVLTGGVFLMILAALSLARAKKWRPRGGRIPLLAYAAFLVCFVASLFVSQTPTFGLSELLLFVNSGLIFLILSGAKITEKELLWLCVGITALATADTLIGYFIYTQTAFPRFAGTFIDLAQPYTSFGNDYANFILLILPVAGFLLFRKHTRFTTTVLSGLAVSILLSGFLLSFSRAALFVALFLLLFGTVWLIIHRRAPDHISHRSFFSRGTGVVLLTILLICGLQGVRAQKFETTSLLEKITFSADEKQASVSERLAFWKGAVALIRAHPLFGTGVQSFRYLFPRHQKDFGIVWDHPHNIILKIGVENGVFAAGFFIIFIVGVGIVLVRFFIRNPTHPAFFLAVGAASALIHNLLDYNFIVANFVLCMSFLGISLTIALSAASHAAPVQESFFAQRNFVLGIACFISFCLLLLGFHETYYNVFFKKGRDALAAGNASDAVPLLEKSSNMFFPRDLATYLDAAYRRAGSPKEESFLEKEITHGSLDASLYSRLAEIKKSENKFGDAEQLARHAIELDPMNQFKYYYDLFEILRAQHRIVETALQGKVLALLSEYKIALRDDAHDTVLTENPAYAAKLYDFFGRPKDTKEIDQIAMEELQKFILKYGPRPTLQPL